MNFTHGGDIYRNKADYDFSANINPLGMPAASIRAARAGVAQSVHYPDYLGENLCLALSQKEHIKREQILLGNGAAELIYTLAAVLKPKKALLTAPAFSEYESALQTVNCTVNYYRLNAKKRFQMERDILHFIEEETDMLFLCNPNNPTGHLIERELLCEIAEACQEKQVTLVVDECFLEFVEGAEKITMTSYLTQFRNLVVIKAFTKVYAMPGLRLGYALSANTELIERLKSGMQPWNTSVPAQMAGIAALKDATYLKHTRALLRREKKYLLEQLQDGLVDCVYGSNANFIFFKAEEELAKALLTKKIMIRDCSNFQSLNKGYYRIAVRTHKENKQLITVWRTLKEEAGWQKQL